MPYRALVTVILTVHFGYLGYVVVGGFAALRWPRALWPHVAACCWGVAVIAVPLTCPLTAAEQWGRRGTALQGLHRPVRRGRAVPAAVHQPAAGSRCRDRFRVLGHGLRPVAAQGWLIRRPVAAQGWLIRDSAGDGEHQAEHDEGDHREPERGEQRP